MRIRVSQQLLLTCEHAGNKIPAAYASLFAGADDVLAGHRGWDIGAFALAQTFKRQLNAPLLYSDVTRLLVELNRSIGHRRLYSEFTAGLDKVARQTLLQQYYHPYRNRVEAWINQHIESGASVVHLSLHTFTPTLNGQSRLADVGLLYDPRRPTEKALCDAWKSQLTQQRPDLRVRRNYPYLGKADGFTTYLRRQFGDNYAGIELEVNQAWPGKRAADWRSLQLDLANSFTAAQQQQ